MQTNDTNHVEFISYTGKWPNLCSGVLTLKIDGKDYTFGHAFKDYDQVNQRFNDSNLDTFWHSGGSCNCYYEGIQQSEWIIDEYYLPDELKKYADEISEVFNSNVPYGCCGGCI